MRSHEGLVLSSVAEPLRLDFQRAEHELEAAVAGFGDPEQALGEYFAVLDCAIHGAPEVLVEANYEIRQIGGNSWGPLFLSEEQAARAIALFLSHQPSFGSCVLLRRAPGAVAPERLFDSRACF